MLADANAVVGEFNREVVPMLQLGDPLQVQSRLKHGMRDGMFMSFSSVPTSMLP